MKFTNSSYQKPLLLSSQRFKKTSTRHIKVPEGCFKIANEKGILSDLIFYYQLKSINTQGFFRKGQIVKTIQSVSKLSVASIWRKLKRLISLNFIRTSHNGYSLISSDNLFQLLGYQIKDGRLDCKLFKLAFKHIDNLRQHVIIEEYKLSQQRQAFRARKIFLKCSDTEKPDAKLQLNESVEFFRETFKRNITQYINKKNQCNIDLNLTLKSFAKLIGYKTAVTGHRIQRMCVKTKLIEVNNRSIYYSPYFDFNQLKALGHSFFLKHGCIFKQLPNELILL